MFAFFFALQVATAEVPQSPTIAVQPVGAVAKIIRKGDGLSEDTAFKVSNVRQEYEILRVYGLEPHIQSLVNGKNGKNFDVLEAKDPKTGKSYRLWFDISSFYGKGFGF